MAMEHLRSHTGLRGFAALTVAPVHMYCEKIFIDFDKYVLPFFNAAFAVDIFFVLSGFILPYVYHKENGEMNSPWSRFFLARFARIYPLHFLTILLAGTMVLFASAKGLTVNRPYSLNELPSQLTLTHAFPGIEQWAWNHPSWSISMEFFAYVAIFPALTLLARRKTSFSFKVASIALLSLLYGFTYWICDLNEGNSAMGWYAIGRVISGFCIGFVLCKIHENHPSAFAFVRGHCDFICTTFLIAYLTTCFHVFPFQWLILIVPFFVLALASNDKTIAGAVFGNRIAVWLGTISYSVYMIHTLFGKIIIGLSQSIPKLPHIGGVVVLIFIFAALLLASTLSFHFFENPARLWITNFGKRLSQSKNNLSPLP